MTELGRIVTAAPAERGAGLERQKPVVDIILTLPARKPRWQRGKTEVTQVLNMRCYVVLASSAKFGRFSGVIWQTPVNPSARRRVGSGLVFTHLRKPLFIFYL